MKIIRKAGRDLPQARVKSINSLLGYNAKQRDLIRSKLASILPNTSMKECQELIDKVSEFTHSKVKQRQINKFNKLMQKEGKITWQGSQGTQGSAPPRAARASPLQAVSTHSPVVRASFPQVGSSSPQPVSSLTQTARSSSSQEGSLPPQAVNSHSSGRSFQINSAGFQPGTLF